MKKILIFYASYGGGHLSAAKSVQSCINEYYPECETELVDCMKYVNKPIEKITTTAYKEMAKKAPWAWGKLYDQSQKGTLAHISSRSNAILAIKLLKLLREKSPDLIISTHPFASQMCCYLKRKQKINSKIATIMTDFSPHYQWIVGKESTDYFFISNNKMKEYLLQNGVEESKVFITGIPLSSRFLQNYDKTEILKTLGFTQNKPTILFFAGGEFGLGKNQTLAIFDCLVDDFDNLQVIAVAGKNEKMQSQFEQAVKEANKQSSIKVLPFTNKVPELMAVSDLVITKPGGLTITESLASSLPIVVISPIPGQEEENATFLEQNGVAVWIKKEDDPKKVLQNLFSNPKKLEEMKENTKKLAHKNSTKNICDILLQNQK